MSTAPELAPYLDEPRQMRSGAPGKTGRLEMRFEQRGRRSVLARLHRRAPLLVQQALYWDEELPGLPCVYVITTSGCVLQGDRLDIHIDVEDGAMAHVTTQAATKIHSMDANYASQTQRFVLGEGAYLEHIPGACIPHRHSRFLMDTRATVHPTATLVSSEILMPGRKYHGDGELFEYDVYSSTTTADRPDGRELFTEKYVIEPWRHPIRRVGAMGEFDVLGTVVVVTPTDYADAIFDRLKPSDDDTCVSGASRLPNDAGLIFKTLGLQRETVQAQVRQFWGLAREVVLGASIPPAPMWG